MLILISIPPLRANTFRWLVTPDQYDKIEFYGDGIYKCHQDGRVWLIDDSGDAILGSKCDSITPCVNNGFSLLLENIGEQEATLVGVFNSKSHKVTLVESGRFVVKLDYAFFSDDRLPIRGSNGMWGYLSIDGSVAIPCEYSSALPFYSKCAPVKKDGEKSRKYIKPNGVIAFTVGVNDAQIDYATPFFRDNTAYVRYNGNRNAAQIDRKGKVVSKDKFKKVSEWLTEYREHVDYNLLFNEHEPQDRFGILKSQLEVIQAYDNNAIVRMNGKMGILQLLQGDFILGEPTKFSKTEKKKKQKIISMQLDIPEGLSYSDLTFEIDKGDGQLHEAETKDYQISNDKRTITFEFPLSAKANSKNANLRFVVKNHDLIIFNVDEIQVQINSPDPPNPDDKCVICGGKKHNTKHQQCRKCGYYIGDVLPQFKCEGNGHHDQCTYKPCRKYKFKKCNKGYEKNQCPQSRGKSHPRP